MIEKIKNNKLKTIVALISTFVFCIGLASSITSGVGDTYAESSSDYDCPIGGSLYFGTISTGSTGYYCQLGDTVLISASYTNYKVGADISSDSDCRSYLSEMGYVYNTSGFYCTYDAIRHQNSSGDIDVNNSCYYCSTMTAGNNTVFGPKEPSTICLNSSWQNISGITSESDCISYGYSAGDDPSGDTEFFNTHIKYNAAYDGKHSEVSYNATSTNSSGTSFTWGVDSSGNILKNGEVAKTTVYYGNNIATSGLMNYNNKELFYATRKGYHVVDGEEWKCMSGCTTSGKVFDQSVSYVSTDFCSSYSDACTVVIGINWVIDTYTIKYDANGGSGAPSSQTKTYGKSLTLSTTKPTKTGFTFLGWSASSSATNATWKAGDSYTVEGDDTLYAVWE